MKFNSDFKHDLEVGQAYENQLAHILGMNESKVEVKRDFKAMNTGNIFVEYFCRGKLSGIATSDADFYCYFLSDDHFIMTTTNRLKEMCRPYLSTKRDVVGGDSNTSKGILLPLENFIKL
jgi:hypothetical protein